LVFGQRDAGDVDHGVIRRCDGTDPNLGRFGYCQCGRTFDDVTHSVIYPHAPLPPKLTLEELEALFVQATGMTLDEMMTGMRSRP
jgi:hypothetical protein